MLPTPLPLPPRPTAAPTAPVPTSSQRKLGQQLLIYSPDGPLGGTFTCSPCRAQAWQPDLLQHAPGYAYGPQPPGDAAVTAA